MDTEDDMSSIGGYGRGNRGGINMGMLGDGGGDGDDSGPDMDDLLEGDMDDVRRLGVVWVKERGVPDIMQWEGDLMDGVFNKIEQQVSWLFVYLNIIADNG